MGKWWVLRGPSGALLPGREGGLLDTHGERVAGPFERLSDARAYIARGTRLNFAPDELAALDDALSFVEGARWEDENTADFRAVVRKVRSAREAAERG